MENEPVLPAAQLLVAYLVARYLGHGWAKLMSNDDRNRPEGWTREQIKRLHADWLAKEQAQFGTSYTLKGNDNIASPMVNGIREISFSDDSRGLACYVTPDGVLYGKIKRYCNLAQNWETSFEVLTFWLDFRWPDSGFRRGWVRPLYRPGMPFTKAELDIAVRLLSAVGWDKSCPEDKATLDAMQQAATAFDTSQHLLSLAVALAEKAAATPDLAPAPNSYPKYEAAEQVGLYPPVAEFGEMTVLQVREYPGAKEFEYLLQSSRVGELGWYPESRLEKANVSPRR